MFVPGLPPTLRRAVYIAQSYNQCRVACDVWRFGQCRTFNRKSGPGLAETENSGAKKPRPKTVPLPKITLVSPDNSITVTVLEEAQRLAKRRNLTLVKVSDLESKTQRPLYQLMKTADILEETEGIEEIVEDTKSADKAAHKSDKGTKPKKILYISTRIAEHDLQTKTRNVVRLLKKGHKIKIAITLDHVDGGKTQKVIEDVVKDNGSVQRMPSKKHMSLLLISPLPKNEDVSVDKTGSSSTVNEKIHEIY